MACRQRRPSAMTSGPTPSPASTATRAFMRGGLSCAALERLDLAAALEQVVQLIEAAQQAVAREGFQGKGHGGAARQGERAGEHVERHWRAGMLDEPGAGRLDRKSTRLNSSHLVISYAGFCLKKKNTSSLQQYVE